MDKSKKMPNKTLTIVSACYNEAVEIIQDFYTSVKKNISRISDIDIDVLIIDNAGTDDTRSLLEKLASKDKKLKAYF